MTTREALLNTDEDFRRLVTEHQSLDHQINELTSHSFLSDEQRLEASLLKKRKLALKDRIEALVRTRHDAGANSVPQH